jgi:hypothetical protein
MPTFNFRLTGTIESDDEQSARDVLNNLQGISDIDIEDGPDEVVEEEEEEE